MTTPAHQPTTTTSAAKKKAFPKLALTLLLGAALGTVVALLGAVNPVVALLILAVIAIGIGLFVEPTAALAGTLAMPLAFFAVSMALAKLVNDYFYNSIVLLPSFLPLVAGGLVVGVVIRLILTRERKPTKN